MLTFNNAETLSTPFDEFFKALKIDGSTIRYTTKIRINIINIS